MAHCRIIFIGNPDTIYNGDKGYWSDFDGYDGIIAFTGSHYTNIMLLDGSITCQALAKDIDWDATYERIIGVFREDIGQMIYRSDFIKTQIQYDTKEELMKYIKDEDYCTMLDIHL